MDQKLKERQLLLKSAFKALKIKDCPAEMDWNSIARGTASANWEVYPMLWHGKESLVRVFCKHTMALLMAQA